LAIPIRETPDGFKVTGGGMPSGGEVNPHGDHRLAMALSLVGLAGNAPVVVQGAEVITESFPEFVSALQNLGASLVMER